MKAMNKPIPAEIDFLRQSGRDFAIYSLAPVIDKTRKITPERRIIHNPSLYPLIGLSLTSAGIIKETKKELSPIPQA